MEEAKRGAMWGGLIDVARDGYIWFLERTKEGPIKFVDATPHVKQNVYKSIDPKTGRPEVDPARKPGTGKSAEFCPSHWGGKNWPPIAFNPQTRLVYIPANENLCSAIVGREIAYTAGASFVGATSTLMFGENAELPDYFVDAQRLSPADHVVMQAACQTHVDASISKTINLPRDISFDAFKGVYEEAYASGCKGCTTYRPNDVTGAVLEVKPETRPPAPAASLPAFAAQTSIVEAILHEDVRPAAHPALGELAPPRLDALDRGAEMGAIADGERCQASGLGECGRQCHRAADRFADQMKPRGTSGICHREHVRHQQIERPVETRRGRPAVAAHVPHHEAIAIDQRRQPS